jgi:hypothetical protein
MKANLYCPEISQITVDLPEAQALRNMHARLNIYSHGDCVIWEATTPTHSVQHVSTYPDPAGSLTALATKLRSVLAVH